MSFSKIDKINHFLVGFLRYNIVSNFKVLPPKSLIINLTYNCNSRCIMCNIWKMKPKKELSFIGWKRILKDQIFKNIENLTVSGGEVFLFKDLHKTIKLFINKMPNLKRLVINTNGFLVNKITRDTLLISEYCSSKKIKLLISISIDGVGKEHDEIRGIDGGFKKVEDTLTQLKKLSLKKNFNVGVASLLMDKNIDKYFQMKKWLHNKKIDYSFQLIGFHETYVHNLEKENSLNFNKKNKYIFFKVLNDLKKSKKIFDFNSYYWNDMYKLYKNKKRRTTPCPFLKDDFTIDSLGNVYYCLSVRPIGNFIKEKKTINDIYFDPKNIIFRKSLWKNECKFCNSQCDVRNAIAYDFKKFLKFKLTV